MFSTGEQIQDGTAFLLKNKTFDEMNISKDDKVHRIFIKKHPLVIDHVCDVIRKNRRMSLQTIHHRGTYLGSKKIQADDRINTLTSEYNKIVVAVTDIESEKIYSRLRKQESFGFETLLSPCTGLNLSIAEMDIAILSDISKKIGYYPSGIFVISFLIGVRDAIDLNEFQRSRIDKELSSFWEDVERRIFKLTNNVF